MFSTWWMDDHTWALGLAEWGNTRRDTGEEPLDLSCKVVTKRSWVQRDIKHLSHALYWPLERAQLSAHVLRLCTTGRKSQRHYVPFSWANRLGAYLVTNGHGQRHHMFAGSRFQEHCQSSSSLPRNVTSKANINIDQFSKTHWKMSRRDSYWSFSPGRKGNYMEQGLWEL